MNEDYKNGDVKLCEVLVEDFIDSTINHLYKDNGEETWCGGEVFDVDIDSEDMENPDFFVTYVKITPVVKKMKMSGFQYHFLKII